MMLDEQLNQYLLGTLPENADWVDELEARAELEHIPIMDRVSMHFLMQLIRMSQPKRILEIGTAIGYSALRMNEAKPDTSIVTIERDQARYEEAIDHIKRLKKDEAITVMLGDAKEVLLQLAERKETFDFIFIDAAKGQYKHFFELSEPLLHNGGVIVSDNILFRGYVANLSEPQPRHRTLVEKIKRYNEWLTSRHDYVTSIVPIGDGVAISLKQSGK